MFMQGSLLLLLFLGKKTSAEFVDGKPDFFDVNVPSPLAYYYLDDGSGYNLKESVSGDSTAGSVIFDADHQININHTEPNWVDDEYFGKTIACGEISNKTHPTEGFIQKDTLSLKDVDYGYSGAWAWSVWFRHEKDVNFPNYQREQFFGHGDPTKATGTINQIHVQYEKSGNIRTIVADSNDGDAQMYAKTVDTAGVKTDNGNWHHLVLTTREDGYKGWNLYIDGVLQASSPMGGGNIDPTDSSVWVAAGGEPIDPIGPIRLCGREQAAGFNENRYFRGQVAHFSVWDSALSQFEVSALYFSYSNRYGLSKQPEPEPEPVPESDPEPCPLAEPCEICGGVPIANPLKVVIVTGFPPESCGNIPVRINDLACQYGLTPEATCELAIPEVREICCVADGSQSPPVSASTEPAPVSVSTESDLTPTAAAPTPNASDGISIGAIVGILVGSISILSAVVFLVYKMDKSSTEYDTNSPAIKAAIEDHKELEKELSHRDSETENSKETSAKEDATPV